jgi:HD-GYP domain-containing protein (c-di-GMP phosphodiesterase class II)
LLPLAREYDHAVHLIPMKLLMDVLMQVIAQALDMVEIAYLGVSTNHGKRIAVLINAMGRYLSMDEVCLSDLISCAMLHDNALTEYILLQQGREDESPCLKLHCELGQQNVDTLPFRGDIQGFLLYHHERADGLGLFGKPEGTYPLGAELIAAADMLDAERHLQRIVSQELPVLREHIVRDIHRRFTGRAGEALLAVLNDPMLASLRDDRIAETFGGTMVPWSIDIEDPAIIAIGGFIARIIDHKSRFTRVHTLQIANRSWLMADYYGYDGGQKNQLFLAAALHDLGKLTIPSEILEKPGPLNPDEFEIIKTHIVHTRTLLTNVEGLGPIAEWASNHHEKLNGKGYPQGKTAAELDFNSRLMACIDVYQAVSEERPYHPRRSHTETMPILYAMTAKGELDPSIVADLDVVMAAYSNQDVPKPTIGQL